MKQEVSTDSKVPLSLSPIARLRASKVKESPQPDSSNAFSPAVKTRARQVATETNNTHKATRSPGLTKTRSGEDGVASKGRGTEEYKLTGRLANRIVEQHARIRRRVEHGGKTNDDDGVEKRKDLESKLAESENLVKDLQTEIFGLKAQLEKLQTLNGDLESQNRRFRDDLAAADTKISALSSYNKNSRDSLVEKIEYSGFREAQKVIANKLAHLTFKKEPINGGKPLKLHHVATEAKSEVAEAQAKGPGSVGSTLPPPPPPSPPFSKACVSVPPPPPLPPRRGPSRSVTMQRAPALVAVYHSLAKREKEDQLERGIRSSPIVTNAHSSIVGEIQNRSSHLLAIKADIETKAEFIKLLIQKVRDAAYADIEDVLTFVEWLDGELSSLSDERAVLKHFEWPEKKADAMREAAFEYRDLKRLHIEISSCEDDPAVSCEVALKKMANLLDRSEKSIQKLIRLRDSTMPCYRDCQIPTDWMLDSGMIARIKLATVKLAKVYMKRVSMELGSARRLERESMQEALMHQCIRFAYRAHQFAGGLDSDTMCAFDEMRQRLPAHRGESRELIAGMAS